MALIVSTATGNFNAGATWVGGIVPGVGDEARAATGHTITITANVTCTELSNDGTGIYTLNNGVTLTANVTAKSTTANRNVVQFTAASPAAGFIVGNVTGATVSANIGAVNNTSSGTLTITGNVTGGSGNNAIGCNNNSTGTLTVTGNVTGGSGASQSIGCNNVSSGTLTVTGNVTGGSGVSQAYGCNNNSSGTLTVTGNATGGSGSSAYGCHNNSSGTLTITGNVTGGSGSQTYGCSNNSTGTLTVTGNATGGSGNLAYGCHNASSGTLTVTGNATGGSGNLAYGCNNNSTGTLTVTGIATGGTTNGAAGANNASSGTLNVGRAKGNDFGIGSTAIVAGVGVTSAQASITKVKEIEYGLRGMSPTSGPTYLEPLLTNVAILVNYPSGSGSKTLSDPNNTAGLSPAATDVRNGVVYNYGVNTGTCAVPAAGSVAFGVPTDNTTGTATLTAANVRAAIGLATANLDTQLADLPTSAENADAVWDEATSGHTTAGTYGGRVVRSTNSNNELQLTGSHHAAADIHEFQTAVIDNSAFATSAVTLFTTAMRTEITPELDEIGEIHAIHGLKSGSALTVTPSSRVAGAISQSITGDGTTTTTVTRT